MRITMIAVLAVLVVGIALVLYVRRELPYNFDVIRTGDGVAIVTVESWVSRDLDVEIRNNGKVIAGGVIDSQTHSGVVDSVGAPGASMVEVSRTDLLGRILYSPKRIAIDLNGKPQDYFVLIGASIGDQWNLPGFPGRINNDQVVFGNRVKYDFDKSELIEPVLKSKFKPKAMIIKLCSAYFPRDIEDSVKYKKQWVEQVKNSGIIPVMATTTPVGKSPDTKEQQESIDQWNQAIRERARKEQYYVLDLAKALRTGIFDNYLKPGYFIDDGLHMTPLAYKEAFDPALKALLSDLL